MRQRFRRAFGVIFGRRAGVHMELAGPDPHTSVYAWSAYPGKFPSIKLHQVKSGWGHEAPTRKNMVGPGGQSRKHMEITCFKKPEPEAIFDLPVHRQLLDEVILESNA